MLQFYVANDNGNSEQDMFINDTFLASPNVLARVMRLPNLDEVSPDEVLRHIHENLIVSIDGATYYIGSYALASNRPCRSITVGVDNNKVTSDIVYINTLAHIAGEAVKVANEKGKAESVIPVTVEMTTAIPVSYYTKTSATTFEEKFTKKEHTIHVFVGPKEYTVLLTFSFVKCIPEGVTASHAFLARPNLFDPSGKTDKERIMNERILHVAIGEGTTEFPLTTGIAFNPNFISGTHNGNGHAIARVLDLFKEDFGLMNITRQDFSRYIRDDRHKYHQEAMAYLLPALDDEAEAILRKAEQVILAANNEVDVVAVYGGGSILMKDALKSRLDAFCKRARIRLLYIEDPKEAVALEAEGLNAFLHSPLFEALKERAQKTA